MAQETHLDGDYLEVDGQTFCPRNGGDKTNNTYWQGMMGTGRRVEFRVSDGDGDYADNSGTIAITITRLEPILYVWKDTLNFGKIRPNSLNPRLLTDTLTNIGSPLFPGCPGTVIPLTYRVDSITGDIGTVNNNFDGFVVGGLAAGRTDSITQGYSLVVSSTF